ncbi:MAG: SRPBCC family protein [Chitinophagaceae bacterium]
MPYIHLTTFIAAPVERVFNLSRSIDVHKHSMKKHGEEPVGGLRSGLMNVNDIVTWQAKHLFKERKLKVKITAMQVPFQFTDEMVEGDFTKLKHEHYFKPIENGTIMIDQFWYEIPYGKAGAFFNYVFFNRYMEGLLQHRNEVIKQLAEGEQWKKYLQQ